MKIEFTREEVEQIILLAAQKFDPKMNTVKIEGAYGIYGATASYVSPVDAAEEKRRNDEIMADYYAPKVVTA